MATLVSPGIQIQEIDLTASAPSTTATKAGFAGEFQWGPIEEITPITSETALVSTFGKPRNDATAAASYLTATSFLAYSNDLLVVRTTSSTSVNAGAAANTVDAAAYTATLIKNSDAYINANETIADTSFAAKYAGTIGNSLAVAVCPSSSAFTGWQFASYFDAAPGTSSYASERGASTDEMHIVVYDENGLFTGVANTILERYPFVSKASDAKNDDGSTNYFKDVITRTSNYVYYGSGIANGSVSGTTDTSNWGTATAAGKTYGAGSANVAASFAGGVDAAPANGDANAAYALYISPEFVDISMLMSGVASVPTQKYIINSVVSARKDCVAMVSPPLANTQAGAASIATWRSSQLNIESSYTIADSGWKYMYDKYNDKYRWVPLNGDITGLLARTDQQRDPWFSPAGYTRGVIKNCVKLAFNPISTERDTLYKLGVNPVVTFPGEGTILYGDKTLLSKPSAWDRINVRRLFLALERTISRAAKSAMFEFNDDVTRSQFVNMVEPYLRYVQGRRGVTDYRVICDTTNNTQEVIDRNEFVGDIFIKPSKSINFVRLNFVAVRSGVSFEEVAGSVVNKL
jgi:phage tail sheath protein FI